MSDLVWSHAAGMPRSALLARGGVRVVEGMRELADAVAEAVGAIQARS